MNTRVLVIDGDTAAAQSIQQSLNSAGFATELAATTIEAQNLFRQNDYDVVVVDLATPTMTGVAFLDWIRTHLPAVVPVVLSRTASAQQAIESVRHGAFDFIPKPIADINVFGHRITRAAEHKHLEENNVKLLRRIQETNVELENRLGQLEIAHSLLQSQAMALQTDLNRAMRVQQRLLPQDTPFSDRISLAAVYRPIGKVGGDLYDALMLDEHRLGLYVADTSGHGVSSAMVTVFLKYAIQPPPVTHGRPPVLSPAQVLRELNQSLLTHAFGPEFFVSMTYVVLNVDTLEAHYSSAGHRPLFIRRRNGAIERLRHPAPALGINAHVKYTDASVSFASGDLLILFTDGLTDARNPNGDFYGEDRLQKAIAKGDTHADTLAAYLDDDVLRFSVGRPYEDDLTLVILGLEPQRKPLREPQREEIPQEPVLAREIAPEVMCASHDGRVFIAISGGGTWQESQEVLKLCTQARQKGERAVVLDFGHCSHLDSTFLGVLHTIATDFDREPTCRLEIQNIPRALLKEMSELGLTALLLHFRPSPHPLPESMHTVETAGLARAQMGRLLLHAHEALVNADPRNADRFADLLKVLHTQTHGTHQKP